MKIVVDTHGHIDDRHDVPTALEHAGRNLARLVGGDPDCDRAIVIAERARQGLFHRLATGATRFPGVVATPTADRAAVRVEVAQIGSLALIAGRQVVTAERLEILALGIVGAPPEDGLDFATTLRTVADTGAFPVLPWSPGKWLGARGRLVAGALALHGNVGLADSGLRPAGYPVPNLLGQARRRGIPVVAGSDPFPLRDEERRLGSYATTWDAGWDAERPATSLVRLLRDRAGEARWVGSRCSFLGVAMRLLRLRWAGSVQIAGPSA